MCVGRKGEVKRHRCFGVPNSPGSLYFQHGLPPVQPANPPRGTHRIRQVSAATLRSRGDSHAEVTATARESPRGAIPLSGRKGTLSVRPKHAPARAFRSRRWRVSPLSGGRARPGPGPRGRSSGASWPGLVLTASRGGRCASPPGPAQGGAQPAPLPGAPSQPAPGARRPRPPRRPQLQPVFVASSGSTARPRLVAPRFARGWGSLLLRLARTCSGPGASPGMHQPPQVAKSGGEKEPAPPPPAPSPGVGGGEAGEQRQPRRRQRAAEARMQPRGPRRLEITGPGGAGSTRGRPEGRCTETASSRGAAGAARTRLSRARGLGRRTGAPGTSASRRLARAGVSPRFRSEDRAFGPRRRRARLFAFPGR